MIGSFLTRGLVLIFGYAFPAYKCFKSVEMNKPDIQQLRFWCQYWILVAALTVCERFTDAFFSCVPMYGEAKLAFFIYLWCPKTKGTTYVYGSFFRPVLLRHEADIDRNLLELRTRAADMAFLCLKNAASDVQTRVFDILRYIASQSIPSRPTQDLQPQRQSSIGRKHTAKQPNRRSAAPTIQVQAEEQASPAFTESSSENEADATEEGMPPQLPSAASTAVASLNPQKETSTEAFAETTKALSSSETQVVQIDSVPSSDNRGAKPPVETVMEEAVPVTRARARKVQPAPNP